MKTNSVCLLFAASMMLPLSLEAKVWKEAGSDRSLEGEFSRIDGDQVVLIRANGTSVKVPLAKLSDEDKAFVTAATAPKASTTEEFKWETDLEVAKKRAKDEKKTILVDFTGSDWCGWCIKLKKEVFDQPEFKEYAKKNLVMLELDFPRRTELAAKLKEQNERMAKEFKVEGFPTILLMNSQGKEVARTGYQEGGPEAYIKHVKKLMK
jgi:thioredoxin-related protein